MADDVVMLFGGPFSGASTAPYAVSLIRLRPPFFCAADDTGVWHHYVMYEQDDLGWLSYGYGGGCAAFTPHPDCGHDHTGPPAVAWVTVAGGGGGRP